MATKNKISGVERKKQLAQIVDDCRQIAQEYIRSWKPQNSQWETVEGCAYLRLSTEDQVLVEKGSLEQQIHIAVQEVQLRSQSDLTNYRIIKFFIEPGITGRHDKPFNRSTLYKLLTNRRYIGKWELNIKNKSINPKKLMPYERHTEVSLPHGAVVDIDLWNRVQQTVERITGSKSKNTKIKRVFLLSGLLKLQTDGSPFSGTGAWGRSKKRTDYYYNQTHKIRLSAEDLETEAKRTVSQIIRGSKPFQDAIKQKSLATDSLKQFLDSQTRLLNAEISSLSERKQAAARRFDLLTVDASDADLKLYRDDYRNEMDLIRQDTEQKQGAIDDIQLQRENLSFNEVETSTLIDRAQDTLGRIEAHDPVALKNAYQELFEGIYVSLSPSEGSAVLNFVLRGHKASVITEEEKDSFDNKVVGSEGLEPPIRRL